MSRVIDVDVAVIGAGLAGLSAANRVAEARLSVEVFEQSTDEAYLCNSRYTGGLFHIAMDDMAGEAGWVKTNLIKATRGTADPALAEALTQNARRTLSWLSSKGIRFIKGGPDGLRRNSLSPPGVRQTGLNWRGRAGDVMLRTLADRLVERGGKLSRGMTAQQLEMENGRCVGFTVANTSGETVVVRARAVVIADGGFQANPELVSRFITKNPEQLLQRNAGSGAGAGLVMAEAVGAKLVGTGRFYGHLHHRRAMTDGGLWPYPVLDSLATAGIVVDGKAQRFCNEGLGGVFVTNAIAQLDAPVTATVIFDEATWNGPGRDWLLPANPYLINAGGEMQSTATLAELALKVSLNPEALIATVESYNRMLEGGPADGQPVRSISPYKAWPVKQGPFHAIPLCAGLTYTMGGIATDANARVLDTSDAPIAGLYAAGSCTGGLEGGGEAAGYSGGLSKASVFGLLAGDAIVVQVSDTFSATGANKVEAPV